MSERQVEITTQDGIADAYLLSPQGEGPFPAVILHADIKGVRTPFVEMASWLASYGYVVLLPNLYYRLAPAPVIDMSLPFRDERTQARISELRASVSIDGIRRDHAAFLEYLAAQPNVAGTDAAIVGYCMSGAIALRTAADFPDRIVAAASIHGGRLATENPDSPHLRAGEIRARLYLGHAKDDASMPPEAIANLETALVGSRVRFDTDYFESKHGFAVPDSEAYNEAAAQLHWSRLVTTLAWAFNGTKRRAQPT